MPDVSTLDEKFVDLGEETARVTLHEIDDDGDLIYWVVLWESQAEPVTDPEDWPPSKEGPTEN